MTAATVEIEKIKKEVREKRKGVEKQIQGKLLVDCRPPIFIFIYLFAIIISIIISYHLLINISFNN